MNFPGWESWLLMPMSLNSLMRTSDEKGLSLTHDEFWVYDCQLFKVFQRPSRAIV